MAHVERQASGRYKVRWRQLDGRERSLTVDTAREAKAERARVEAELQAGTYVDPQQGRRITVEAYAAEWVGCQVWRPSTETLVRGHFKNHVLPRIGARPLATVRASEVQGLVKLWSATLAPSTATTIYRFVSAMFAAAVRDRILPVSPCEGVRLPKAEPNRAHAASVEEVAAIIDAAPDRLRAAFVLAAMTGARPGEVLGATVASVDWLRRTWRIDRQLVSPARGVPHLAPPKTAASVRTVALTDATVAVLSEHLRQFPAGDDGLLFTDDPGNPWRRSRLAEAWHRTCKAAGVEGLRGPHSLRHHHASVLLAGGASVKSVQERLGHSSAVETLTVYSHLMRDDDDRTRALLDAAWTAPASEASAAR